MGERKHCPKPVVLSPQQLTRDAMRAAHAAPTVYLGLV
jgi:hypothetical protein